MAGNSMPAANPRKSRQRIEGDFTEYGCRIDGDVLDRIIALIKKDFASDASFDISTKRDSGGITTNFSAESIAELMESLRESTAAGDPEWNGFRKTR